MDERGFGFFCGGGGQMMGWDGMAMVGFSCLVLCTRWAVFLV